MQMSDIMLREAAIYAAAGVGKTLLSIIYTCCTSDGAIEGDAIMVMPSVGGGDIIMFFIILFLLVVVNYYLRMARECLSSGSSKQEVTVVGGCL